MFVWQDGWAEGQTDVEGCGSQRWLGRGGEVRSWKVSGIDTRKEEGKREMLQAEAQRQKQARHSWPTDESLLYQ